MSDGKRDRHIREDIQSKLAAHVALEKKIANPQDRFNPMIMDEGYKWYVSGLELEDAPENLRNNTNFVKGYEKAQRLQNVNDDFFRRGAEAYLNGTNWSDIDAKDLNNPYFQLGYEEAMTMDTRKRR